MTSAWWARAVTLLAVFATSYAQYRLWWWYVEDAAISFAYARNLAEGWGLVRFPGDERIEGYSNPLWVAWMALWQLVGIAGFQSAKYSALALAAVTVPVTARLTSTSSSTSWGVLAGWLLALDASFVIWSASGLENSLFCALLAIALCRTVLEAEEGRYPLAVFGWLGLALTRPEGVVYAALGGSWALFLELQGHRRWRLIAWWLVVFFVPFVGYHAVRYDYFAYPFPATYYAKIGDDPFHPWSWNTRSWVYLRTYGEQIGRFWLSPLVLAGVVGMRGWRAVAVVGLSVWLGIALVYPGVEPFMAWEWIDRAYPSALWMQFRVASIGLIVVLATLFGSRAEGWRTRLLCWGALWIGLGFCIRSGGDWMRGFRWMSLIAVPTTVLLVLGLRDLYALCASALPRFSTAGRSVGGAMVTTAVLGAVVPQVRYLSNYEPETTPDSVNKRVRHYQRAMQRLHLDYVDILDHDMGAMMWWGRDLGIVRDSRGLIDIAFALHRTQPAFVEEYAFNEYPFDFAHGHASTGAAVRRMGKTWTDAYVEIPGYGRTNLHVGNYVRKDLFMRPWEGDDGRAMRFTGGNAAVTLHGVDIPAPEVSPGSWLYVEFGVQVESLPAGTRLLLFLHDDEGIEVSWNLPLGMETWYPVERWGEEESYFGRHALPLDAALPLGDYQIGIVVLGAEGVLAAESPSEDALFANGEVRFPGTAVRLVPRRAMGKHAARDVARAKKEATEGHCMRAERFWRKARAHRSVSRDWLASQKPIVSEPIAACFARRAPRLPRERAVEAMRRARRWSATSPVVQQVGSDLADVWLERGQQLWSQGDDEIAYGFYRDVVFVDPSRAWARRYAEELRVERLKLRH